MNRLIGLSSLAILTLTTACSQSLQTRKVSSAGGGSGIVYVLPMTQFEVVATWQLEACPMPVGDDQAEQDGEDAPETNDLLEPVIALKVEARPRAVDDGDHAYIINPEELQSWTNVTSFEAKWHEDSNMLSSINASVEDRSGQILGNLISTAVSFSPLVLGGLPAAPGAAGTDDPRPIRCSDESIEQLAVAKSKRADLDLATKELKAATANLASVTARIATLGSNVSEQAKEDLSSAQIRLTRAQAGVTAARTALDAAIKPISHKVVRYWPIQSNDFSLGPIRLGSRLESWLDNSDRAGEIEAQELYLQIEAASSFGMNPASRAQPQQQRSDSSDEDQTIEGLPYRLPASGRLVACTVTPCRSEDLENRIASFDVLISQLGEVYTIPFTTRTFGNNSFAAEFGEDGRLKMVRHGQSAAPGEVASGVLSESSGAIAGALDPLARLNRQNEYLAALKTRADALEALEAETVDPIAEQTSALNAQTSLTQATIAEIQARIALEELRATLAEGD